MSKLGVFIALVVLMPCAAVSRALGYAEPRPGSPEETAILHVVQRFGSAWNKADAGAAAAVFSPDGEFVSPSGAIAGNRAEIQKLLAGEFRDTLQARRSPPASMR